LAIPALLAVGGMVMAQPLTMPDQQFGQATVILAPSALPPPPSTMTTSSTTIQVWETGYWMWSGGTPGPA
jgi:hypothetical protein